MAIRTIDAASRVRQLCRMIRKADKRLSGHEREASIRTRLGQYDGAMAARIAADRESRYRIRLMDRARKAGGFPDDCVRFLDPDCTCPECRSRAMAETVLALRS